jgi:ribosomal protein S18 acetylase RimI-like enzyme
MCDIIEITEKNIILLYNFILNNTLPNTFRYFNKRSIDVIKNHIITLILIDNNLPIGYAHIDYHDNQYWFGICILDKYQGNGYGKQLMEYIFNHEKIKNIDKIYLTVDKINTIAIKLYTKFNFYNIDEKDSYFTMCYSKLKYKL